jgi:hypothetical protein
MLKRQNSIIDSFPHVFLAVIFAGAASADCPDILNQYDRISRSATYNFMIEGKIEGVSRISGGTLYFSSIRVKNGGSDPGVVLTCIAIPVADGYADDEAREEIMSLGLLSFALGLDFQGTLYFGISPYDSHRIGTSGVKRTTTESSDPLPEL